jgi:hypothetical protein
VQTHFGERGRITELKIFYQHRPLETKTLVDEMKRGMDLYGVKVKEKWASFQPFLTKQQTTNLPTKSMAPEPAGSLPYLQDMATGTYFESTLIHSIPPANLP